MALRDKLTTLAAPIHGQTPDELAGLDRREQRRFRRLRTAAVTALAMLTVTAVVLAVVAFIQNGRAITQRNHAIAAQLNAEAAAMLIKDEPGGDERAVQQILAARRIDAPDDGVLLSALAQRTTTAKIIDAGAAVFGVAISPDGRLIATAESDRTVRVWDASTGEPVGSPLRGHTDQVGAVAFSPDGRRTRQRRRRPDHPTVGHRIPSTHRCPDDRTHRRGHQCGLQPRRPSARHCQHRRRHRALGRRHRCPDRHPTHRGNPKTCRKWRTAPTGNASPGPAARTHGPDLQLRNGGEHRRPCTPATSDETVAFSPDGHRIAGVRTTSTCGTPTAGS